MVTEHGTGPRFALLVADFRSYLTFDNYSDGTYGYYNKVNGDQWLSDGIGLLALGRKNKGVCFVLLSFFCNFAH